MKNSDSTAGASADTVRSGRDSLSLAIAEYLVSCNGAEASFAVSILGSADLVGMIARVRPAGLCITGRCKTVGIGPGKVIRDTISRPQVSYLLVCGMDEQGQTAGRVLLAVKANGVDGMMRVIGLPGEPVTLEDISRDEIEAFREHVEVADLIGTDDAEAIIAKISELSRSFLPCARGSCVVREKPAAALAPTADRTCPFLSGLDNAGYFLIKPDAEKGMLTVEHYFYDCRLLRRIEGSNNRAIYRTIIDNGWVTQSSHAAYLWRELTRAERSIKKGLKYVQDIELLP